MNKITICILLPFFWLGAKIERINLPYSVLDVNTIRISTSTSFDCRPLKFPDFNSPEMLRLKSHGNKIIVKILHYNFSRAFYSFDDSTEVDLKMLKDLLLEEEIYGVTWCYIPLIRLEILQKPQNRQSKKPRASKYCCCCIL